MSFKVDDLPYHALFIGVSEENVKKFEKLNANRIALGRKPMDHIGLMNEALASRLDALLILNVHPEERQPFLNNRGVTDPQVGDLWSERPGTHYLRVVWVNTPDDFIVHTFHKLAGLNPGRYRMNLDWLKRIVYYKYPLGTDDQPSFCADCSLANKDSDTYRELLLANIIEMELRHAVDIRNQSLPKR